MSTTATQGTSIAVLAPYLEHEITCFWLKKQRKVGLMGLKHFGRTNAVLHSGSNDWCRPGDFLPMLYSFADLCYPLIDNPDTTPAVQMVAIGSPHLKDITAELNSEDEIHIKAGGGHVARLFKNDFEAGAMGLNQAAYLRSQHFAVGLESHQYIRITN